MLILTAAVLIGYAVRPVPAAAQGEFQPFTGGFFEEARRCTGMEKVTLAAVVGGTLGALGLGMGAGIDALITGRRLLYQRPVAVGVIPRVSRAAGGLSISMSW